MLFRYPTVGVWGRGHNRPLPAFLVWYTSGGYSTPSIPWEYSFSVSSIANQKLILIQISPVALNPLEYSHGIEGVGGAGAGVAELGSHAYGAWMFLCRSIVELQLIMGLIKS